MILSVSLALDTYDCLHELICTVSLLSRKQRKTLVDHVTRICRAEPVCQGDEDNKWLTIVFERSILLDFVACLFY